MARIDIHKDEREAEKVIQHAVAASLAPAKEEEKEEGYKYLK